MNSINRHTVSEITKIIKLTLEDRFYSVWIEGEISDFKRHSSGHLYFILKDENAQLSAVMWRGKSMNLPFVPQDGMKVLAKGNITVFERSGRYQLDVDVLQPLGIGDLQMAFEQLKIRLKDEGLFDESHKKPIPPFPANVGIVTSPSGAAIRDIVSIANRRYPGIQLIIRPVRVQGEGSAEEIALGIKEFNEYGLVDVLIVGRGGGSLEDLWSFNEEVVARAIFDSRIPVISAVGHEIDFTIADFTADLRAATPSAAAELVVPDAAAEWQKVIQKIQRLYRITSGKLSYLDEKVKMIRNSHALKMPEETLKQSNLILDMQISKLESMYENYFTRRKDNVNQLENRMKSLNPESVLKRGYSITYRTVDNSIVRDSSKLKTGDGVTLRFARGRAKGIIENIYEN